MLTTRRVVPVGTSGAVSPLGFAASALGAALIGIVALLLSALGALGQKMPFATTLLWLPVVGVIGGSVGSLLDSLLGATVQGIYFCDRCNKETESLKHRCGEFTRHIRGWQWLDNDWVNLISSAGGAVVAVIVAYLLLG